MITIRITQQFPSIGTEEESLQGHKINTMFYDVTKHNNFIIIHSNTKSNRVTRWVI